MESTAALTQSPYRPDLIISKREKFIDGAHRTHRKFTLWIDIVDTHDPRPDWKAKGLPCDDVVIIDIAGLDPNEIVKRIKERIP